MALVKHNNNSISSITTPGQLVQGKMTLISSQTASGSASISFTSGIDSTYPIYRFEFINIHPATDDAAFSFQADTGTNTNYNQTITSTFFRSILSEADDAPNLAYVPGNDLAQSTSFQMLANGTGNDNDQCLAGTLTIFSPASATFVKHFIATANELIASDQSYNLFCAGYFNTTTALTRVRFQMSSGNIDSGTIKLYGIGD
jgi:hypothetical protein